MGLVAAAVDGCCDGCGNTATGCRIGRETGPAAIAGGDDVPGTGFIAYKDAIISARAKRMR